jgi:gluconokinase
MSSGQPLTDGDRWPWLDAIADWLSREPARVVTCSALTSAYRDRLRLSGPLCFVYLALPLEVARARVGNRPEHFMPSTLVDDQFATLQEPDAGETDVLRLDGTAATAKLIEAVLTA